MGSGHSTDSPEILVQILDLENRARASLRLQEPRERESFVNPAPTHGRRFFRGNMPPALQPNPNTD